MCCTGGGDSELPTCTYINVSGLLYTKVRPGADAYIRMVVLSTHVFDICYMPRRLFLLLRIKVARL